jgi:hypothetical protein
VNHSARTQEPGDAARAHAALLGGLGAPDGVADDDAAEAAQGLRRQEPGRAGHQRAGGQLVDDAQRAPPEDAPDERARSYPVAGVADAVVDVAVVAE